MEFGAEPGSQMFFVYFRTKLAVFSTKNEVLDSRNDNSFISLICFQGELLRMAYTPIAFRHFIYVVVQKFMEIQKMCQGVSN